MFAVLTVCLPCGEAMREPHTVPRCMHTVCRPCVDVLDLAELETCPICAGPLGTPVPNVALAVLLAEVAQLGSSSGCDDEPQPALQLLPTNRKRSREDGAVNAEAAAAIGDMKVIAAADRQAYLDALAAFLETARAHGNRRVAAYTAQAAAVIKDAEARLDVDMVRAAVVDALNAAADAGCASAAACPLPCASTSAPPMRPLPRLAVSFAGAVESVYTSTEGAPLPSVLSARVLTLHERIRQHPQWVVDMLAAAVTMDDFGPCLDMMAAWGPITWRWAVGAPSVLVQTCADAVRRVMDGGKNVYARIAPAILLPLAQVLWRANDRFALWAALFLFTLRENVAACAEDLTSADIAAWLADKVTPDMSAPDFAGVVNWWLRHCVPPAPWSAAAGAAVCGALLRGLRALAPQLTPDFRMWALRLCKRLACYWESRADCDAAVRLCMGHLPSRPTGPPPRNVAIAALLGLVAPPHIAGAVFLACVELLLQPANVADHADLCPRLTVLAGELEAEDRAAAMALLRCIPDSPEKLELQAALMTATN
jgi:hypothetical protein